MKLTQIIPKYFSLIFVMFMIAGCASSPQAARPSPQVESVAVAELAGDISTILIPSPVSSSATLTSTLVAPSATPFPSPSPVLEQWDLLVVSDSSNWGVGGYYAKLIDADMKVKVNLHDCWVGTMSILKALHALQSEGNWSSFIKDKPCQKPLADLVKEAEVFVLFGNPIRSDPPAGFDACMTGGYYGRNKLSGFETYKETLLSGCSLENWTTYKTNLGQLIDEIFKIREGRPIILRMTDFYIPAHSIWSQSDVDEACTACIGAFSEAIRQVAEEHGVPVASTIVGLNGLDYMSDPVERGYIRTDGVHPSDKGAQFIAALLQDTGYAYAGK